MFYLVKIIFDSVVDNVIGVLNQTEIISLKLSPNGYAVEILL